VASILLQAALLGGIVVIALWRWGGAFPPAAFTAVFGLNALVVGVARDQYALVVPAVAAGIFTDVLIHRLRPSRARPRGLRVVAFAAPAAYFALFFATLALTRGLWWSLPLWSGAIVLAGAVGWLLSWLVVPPAISAADSG
jgi:hypothetical protein